MPLLLGFFLLIHVWFIREILDSGRLQAEVKASGLVDKRSYADIVHAGSGVIFDIGQVDAAARAGSLDALRTGERPTASPTASRAGPRSRPGRGTL